MECAQLVGQGLVNGAIGQRLGLRRKSVEYLINQICRKLRVEDRPDMHRRVAIAWWAWHHPKDRRVLVHPEGAPSQYQRRPEIIDAAQYLIHGEPVPGMCRSRNCYDDGQTQPHVHLSATRLQSLRIGDWVVPQADAPYCATYPDDWFRLNYEAVDG